MSFSGLPFNVVFPLNTPDLFYFYRNAIRGLHCIGKNWLCALGTILLFLKRQNQEFVIAYVLLCL